MQFQAKICQFYERIAAKLLNFSKCAQSVQNLTIQEGKKKKEDCDRTSGLYIHVHHDELLTNQNVWLFVFPLPGPPSAPRNLRALVDNKSSVITLSWNPPEDNGDRKDISYWIDCPRCPKEAVFSPSKFIQGTEVNISRLESHTSYEFRVHARNGVSEVSGVDNYVSVNATTFSSGR